MLSLNYLKYLAFTPIICGCVNEEYFHAPRMKTEKRAEKIPAKENIGPVKKDLVLHVLERKHIDIGEPYSDMPPRFFVSKDIPNEENIFNRRRVYGNGRICFGIINAPKGRIEIEKIVSIPHQRYKTDNEFIDIYDNPYSSGIDYFLVEPEGDGKYEIKINLKKDGNDIAFGGFYFVLSPKIHEGVVSK